MKQMLKMLLLAPLFLTGCDDERIVTQEQLPVQAQTLLSTYFADQTVSVVTKHRDWFEVHYEVLLADGRQIEFNRSGAWTEIACRPTGVPADLIPQPILQQVELRFPSVGIVEINRDRKNHEVKLSNGVELEFNRKNQLVEFDD